MSKKIFKDNKGVWWIDNAMISPGKYKIQYVDTNKTHLYLINDNNDKPLFNSVPIIEIQDESGTPYGSANAIEFALKDLLNTSIISSKSPLKTSDTDPSGLQAFNGIFGEKLVGHRNPEFSANFTYPLDQRGVNVTTVGTGAVTNENSLLKISTGSTASSSVKIETKRALRYQAGRDAEGMFTAIFTQGIEDSYQRAGLKNNENGFMIGFEGVDFAVFRKRDNVMEDTIIQSNFNEDKLDGTGTSGYTLDPTTINIYRINYGYLGIAPIYYQIFAGYKLGWITYHVIDLTNSQTETHVTNPYLPIGVEVSNGSNAADIIFYSGSIYAGTFGTEISRDASARSFSFSTLPVSYIAGTQQLIVSFHNKPIYQSIVNKVEALLLYAASAVDGNKSVVIELYILALTPTGGNWTDVSTLNSLLEHSTDTTIDLTGAELLLTLDLAKVDSKFLDVEKFKLLLQPNEYAAFVLTSTGATEANLSIRWDELF